MRRDEVSYIACHHYLLPQPDLFPLAVSWHWEMQSAVCTQKEKNVAASNAFAILTMLIVTPIIMINSLVGCNTEKECISRVDINS